MSKESAKNEILQAIMELSHQQKGIADEVKTLSHQQKGLSQQLADTDKKLSGKIDVLSRDLFETRAEVEILKRAK